MTDVGRQEQTRPRGREMLAGDLAELGLAVKASTDRRLKEIAEQYRRALADRRHFPEAVHGLGMVAMRLGRLTIAERLLQTAVESDPSRVDFVGNLGNALKDLGRLDAAVACYRKVLSIVPDSEVAYNNLANTLQEQGDLDAAVASYRRAVEIKPGYSEAWTNLGNTLQKQSLSDQAVEAYRNALQAMPENADAWLNLGVARHCQGEIEDAMSCLEKALSIRPKMVAAFNRIQRIHLEQGDYDEVKRLGRRIRELAPHNQMAMASEAFADLAAGDVARFRYLYAMDGLPHAELVEPPAGYSDTAAFNQALVGEVLAHPSLKWIHDTYDTTRRGFVYGLLDDPPPTLDVFGRLLRDRIEAFKAGLEADPAHPFLGAIPDRFKIKLWATILHRGGYHPPHHHEHNWLGGTYYAKLPGSCRAGTAGTAGAIEFDGFTDLPGLARYGEFVRRIVPVEGLLVLFPAYMMHGTLPFTDDDTRIGLSFDVAAA